MNAAMIRQNVSDLMRAGYAWPIVSMEYIGVVKIVDTYTVGSGAWPSVRFTEAVGGPVCTCYAEDLIPVFASISVVNGRYQIAAGCLPCIKVSEYPELAGEQDPPGVEAMSADEWLLAEVRRLMTALPESTIDVRVEIARRLFDDKIRDHGFGDEIDWRGDDQ